MKRHVVGISLAAAVALATLAAAQDRSDAGGAAERAVATQEDRATVSPLIRSRQATPHQRQGTTGGESVADSRASNTGPGGGLAPPLLPPQFNASQLVRRTVIVSGMLSVASAASLWLGYRRRSKGLSGDGTATPLQLLHTLSISPKCCLYLVRVEDQKFLMASDASGWKSVTAIDSITANFDPVEQTGLVSPTRSSSIAAPPEPFQSRADRWQDFKLSR